MPVRVDPEGTESDTLLAYTGSLTGKRVLEVGAGKGRLTWRYAEQAAHVTAIEPDLDKLAMAEDELPATLQDIVTLLPDSIEDYQPDSATPSFHVAIMSWSL